MRTPTTWERELGRLLRSKFGADTKVYRFGDDEGASDLFIVSGQNCPENGVTSYASVGLSHHEQLADEVAVKVEIVAACASTTHKFDNVVASCVFDHVKNGSPIVYGSAIRSIVTQYEISSTLKHVTFVAPFLWKDLNRLNVCGQTVFCLMMLPISDAEMGYLEDRGIDALEAIFDDKQIDIFDINRPSVL